MIRLFGISLVLVTLLMFVSGCIPSQQSLAKIPSSSLTKTIGPFVLSKGIPGILTFSMTEAEVLRSLGKPKEKCIGIAIFPTFDEPEGKFYESLGGTVTMGEKDVCQVRFDFPELRVQYEGKFFITLSNQQETVTIHSKMTEQEFIRHCKNHMPKTEFYRTGADANNTNTYFLNKDRTCGLRFEKGIIHTVWLYSE